MKLIMYIHLKNLKNVIFIKIKVQIINNKINDYDYDGYQVNEDEHAPLPYVYAYAYDYVLHLAKVWLLQS